MAAEFTAGPQTLLPNQPVIFAAATYPYSQDSIYQKPGNGGFLLASNAPRNNGCNCGCGCRRLYLTSYEVDFHGNIEIPTGGTVEEIQLAVTVDGVIDPASVMSFTPAAVETAGNVGTSIIVSVPSICGCESVAVVSIGTQPITLNNGSLVIDPAGVRRIN